MRKVNWSFKIYIPYAGVRPKLKGLKAGQSTLCRTVTFRLLLPVHLTSCSLIPVLDETVNSNLPTISIKSTQNIMKHPQKRKQSRLLYHTSIQWTEVTIKAQSHQKGWTEHTSSAGLINLAHAVKLQFYSNTDFRKARHCSIQKWNLGQPPTVLQATAAADSPVHIPAIPCTFGSAKPCQLPEEKGVQGSE